MKRLLSSISVFMNIANVWRNLLSLLTLLLFAATAQATTYYVSTSGNDSTGNGSTETPWASLQHASASVTASGDIIHMNAGSYTEHNICNIAVGVSLEGEGKTSTIIRTDYNPNASYSRSATICLDSFPSYSNGNQHVSGIGFDGMNLAGFRAISVNRRSNVSIHDCDIKDFLCSPAAFLNINYESDREPDTYCTGNSFHDNTVENCSLYRKVTPYNFEGLWFEGQDGFEIYNCNISQLVRVSGEGDALVSSKTNRRWKIHDNVFSRTPPKGGYWHFLLEIRWHYGECELYNNAFYSGSVDVPHIFKKSLKYGMIVRNNTFGTLSGELCSGARNYGLTFEGFNYDITVKDNVFKNISSGVSFATGTSFDVITDGVVIKNNQFINMGTADKLEGWGVYLLSRRNHGTFRNINVYNNTITGAGPGKCLAGISPSFDDGTVTNLRMQNNIITNFEKSIYFIAKNYAVNMDTVYMTNNCFYGNTDNTISYSQCTPKNEIIKNNITDNPLFVSTTDFHLQAGSPCIDAGLNVGLPYEGPNPDMGAFENPRAGVTISATPGTSINSGTSVTFTAAPTNGGTDTSYQWKLNGSNVGANSSTYANASLANGNTVSCVMTSNLAYVVGSPAASNTLTMNVAAAGPGQNNPN